MPVVDLREVRVAMHQRIVHGRVCVRLLGVARAHLAQVEAKQRELAALAAELRGMIETCHHDTRATCTILQSLAG